MFLSPGVIKIYQKMNQALLTRLYKTFSGNRNDPTIKMAFRIIEEEKKKGHHVVAEKLNRILEENITQNIGAPHTLKPIRDGVYEMPVDRRYKLPLARFVDHEYL